MSEEGCPSSLELHFGSILGSMHIIDHQLIRLPMGVGWVLKIAPKPQTGIRTGIKVGEGWWWWWWWWCTFSSMCKKLHR